MAKILIALALLFPPGSFSAEPENQAADRPLVIPLAAKVVSFDPRLVLDQSSLWVSRQINCQLVRYEGAEVVNEIAESITYQTPTRIEIVLKNGVRFADGSPVTADDVAATFAYLRRSRRVHRNIFDWVRSIEATPPRTIVIRLKKPVPQFLKTLAAPTQAIYPASFIARVAKDPAAWDSPVGCGGYRLGRRLRDPEGRTMIELAPVRDKLRGVHFVLLGSAQVPAREVGRYDIIGLPVAGDAPRLARDYKTIDLFDPYQIYFALNTKVAPWTDRANRCRLLAALNPAGVAEAYHGAAEPATDWFPRGILGHSERQDSPAAPVSGAGLAGLLSARQDGAFCLAFLSVSIPESVRPSYEAVLRRVFPREQASVISDAKEFGRKFRESRCDAIVFGLKSGYLDAYEFLQFLAEKEANVTNWTDENLIASLRESQDIADSAQRAGAYRLIARQIERACLAKPLVTLPRRRVYYRGSLDLPGIGKTALNSYYLGSVR